VRPQKFGKATQIDGRLRSILEYPRKNERTISIHVGDSLLEIGCAIGTQARQIAARGYQVFGIDQEFSLVAKFNTLANQAHLPNAFAFVADGHALPFPEHSFDSVVITEVLEHAHDPACMLGEIFRVLRRGGTLCLAVPTENTERLFTRLHPQWAKYSGHVQIFGTSQLLSLIQQAGFTVIATRGESSEWTLFWLLFATLRTPFDFTGTPTAHLLLVRIFWKVWRTVNT
jgi:SAM-dependent methyltransferase